MVSRKAAKHFPFELCLCSAESSRGHPTKCKQVALARVIRHLLREGLGCARRETQNTLTALEWASKLLAQPPKTITSPSSLAQAVCHNLQTEGSAALNQENPAQPVMHVWGLYLRLTRASLCFHQDAGDVINPTIYIQRKKTGQQTPGCVGCPGAAVITTNLVPMSHLCQVQILCCSPQTRGYSCSPSQNSSPNKPELTRHECFQRHTRASQQF